MITNALDVLNASEDDIPAGAVVRQWAKGTLIAALITKLPLTQGWTAHLVSGVADVVAIMKPNRRVLVLKIHPTMLPNLQHLPTMGLVEEFDSDPDTHEPLFI